MGLVSLGACVAGFVLDFIFGDPVWLYHPVRLIGKWISFLEKLLRRKTGEKRQIAAGGILWILFPFRTERSFHPYTETG